MATKTISLDLEAYERLVRARQRSNESFSNVVKRAIWADETRTGRAFLWEVEPDLRAGRSNQADS